MPAQATTSTGAPEYDAVVIGGGPAGATAALVMSRAGLKVVVIEKAPHPRFHIGESFLPRNLPLIEELGLDQALSWIPHVVKHGAEFALGHETQTRDFRFDQGFTDVGSTVAFNIERAPFDAMILREARGAGAEVVEGPSVRDVPVLEDGRVAVRTADREYTSRYLLDASGQSAVLGRHLGIRRVLARHQKVAYFGHFTGVDRRDGDPGGFPTVAMCSEGWFWMIPIDAERTSIGLVLDARAARHVQARGVAPAQMLRWAIPRCPLLASRTRRAEFPESNGVCADFSYRCEPFAGPGYFLIGDAAMFVDPIFSTGVCLGMMSAVQAARSVEAIVRRGDRPGPHRRAFIRDLKSSSSVFFRLIDLYYDHSFRELFLHGQGPVQVQRGIISLLAGHVFPRPPWKLRWRLAFFDLCVRLNRRWPLVPRREAFALLDQPDPAGARAQASIEPPQAVGAP